MTDEPINELDEIGRILGVSSQEMADLLHIRAASLAEWGVQGVPLTRRASVRDLYDLASILDAKIVSSRIPEIVRAPDASLGDRSILEVIRAEGVAPIYENLARLLQSTTLSGSEAEG